MIKRIVFATRSANVAAADFPSAWRDAFGASVDAPGDTQPLRAAVCTCLPELTPNPKHDGIGLAWFTDDDHLGRYESWLADSDAAHALQLVADSATSPVVVADEFVMRGADWLDQRWADGGRKFKHMAIARRNRELSLPEFFERWGKGAGKVGAAVIPDEARGQAYSQNRPQVRESDWEYDALNEVYFDGLEDLQARIAYFEKTNPAQAEGDLVSAAWFVAATEELLFNRV